VEDQLIGAKFTEWTKGRDVLAARISVFSHIRDIPYAIVPAMRDPVVGPAEMLKSNMGACVPKHHLLLPMFEKLGIPVKYATYLFYWDDPDIKYPPELRALAKKMPLTGHLACKAKIEDKWVLVDATWDPPLKKAGFPVNENWDGLSDTKCAVSAVKEVLHESLKERLDYNASIRSAFSPQEQAAYEEFVPKLNAWLRQLRGQSPYI
jgi:hypothetical protein